MLYNNMSITNMSITNMSITNMSIKHITLKKILANTIKLIHALFIFIALIGPYVTNNNNHLLSLTLLYMFVISQWYVLGNCFLTNIEYELAGEKIKKYANGSSKGFMSNYVEKKLGLTEKQFIYFVVFVPFFNFLLCLIKIYYKLKNCSK